MQNASAVLSRKSKETFKLNQISVDEFSNAVKKPPLEQQRRILKSLLCWETQIVVKPLF